MSLSIEGFANVLLCLTRSICDLTANLPLTKHSERKSSKTCYCDVLLQSQGRRSEGELHADERSGAAPTSQRHRPKEKQEAEARTLPWTPQAVWEGRGSLGVTSGASSTFHIAIQTEWIVII